MQMPKIYKLGFDQNYFTSTLILLIQIASDALFTQLTRYPGQIAHGTIRLIIFIFVFWMFWAALMLSTSVEVQRGIFTVQA
jgi:hypothetical protein